MKVTLKTVTKHRISLKYFSRQILGKRIECKGCEHLKGQLIRNMLYRFHISKTPYKKKALYKFHASKMHFGIHIHHEH